MIDERCDLNKERAEEIVEDLHNILHQNLYEAEYYEEITPEEADKKYAAVADYIGMLWENEPEDLIQQFLKSHKKELDATKE